jgi:hypothetical protein
MRSTHKAGQPSSEWTAVGLTCCYLLVDFTLVPAFLELVALVDLAAWPVQWTSSNPASKA